MKRMNGALALILAGLLVGPGLFAGSRVYAQSGSSLSEQERQEIEKKYQEQWEFQERLDKEQEDTGGRLEKAVQRRQDAERRQREAEQRLPEQKKGGGGTTQ